jgi:trigger factor
LNIAVEDINATKKRLKIEIPSEIIEKEITESLNKLRERAKIPGFRPGKVPMNLIEKRFRKDVEAEVLDKVIPEYYSKALKEADLLPITVPVIDEEIGFKKDTPLNISFTVEVMPKIENLNYENIKITDMPIVVEDAEVEDYIKRLQEERAVFEVADKDIGMDDLVTFDYADCRIEGEETPSQAIKEHISNMGNEIFPTDVMERVLGKKKGDIFEFTTTFSEPCKIKELIGKTVNIKLMIKEIKKKNLPEIDDEFAKDIGFENIAEMQEKVKERLYALKKEHTARLQKAKIVDKILESCNFEVPETLLEKEFNSLMMQESLAQKEFGDRLSEAKSGEEKENNFENLRTEMEKRALKNVRASIIIETIGRKEGITITDEEVNNRISLLAQRLSTTQDAVKKFYTYKEGSMEGLKHSIFEDKVLDMLLSKAIIEKGE